MHIKEISEMLTTKNGIHESVFRSYHILERVKDLLKRNVPNDVVLELIEEMEEEAREITTDKERERCS